MQNLLNPQNQISLASSRHAVQSRIREADRDSIDILYDNAYGKAAQAIESAIDATRSKFVREIQNDTSLSDKGKADKLATITEAARAEIRKHIDEIEARHGRAESSIKETMTAGPQEDPVLKYQQLKEVRERLADIDDLRMQERYYKDLRAGEVSLLVEALEGDPLPRHFVNAETRARTEQNRAKQLNPDQVVKLTKLNGATAALRTYGELSLAMLT